ncbi:MAG: DUF4097 family beta strand repeat protein [Propionibacteriales bacterium]|nr:DUF4097 family beta strand repeat protein [Propionibacteriales bacterium]
MNTEANMHTFHTPIPVNLKVELWQGDVRVDAELTDTTTIELEPMRGDSAAQELIDHAKVEQRGDEILVLMPKMKSGLFRSRGEVRAIITLPLHSSAKIETGSADIETHGVLGDLSVSSGSGDVSLEHGNKVQVRTGSGDVTIGTADDDCDIKCGSADVTVETLGSDADIIAGSGNVVLGAVGGSLKIKTGSGDIVIKSAGAGVDAMAGSGDLFVRRIQHGRLKAKTGSGDISVGVAEGTAAYLDVMTVTGDVRSSLDASDAPGDGDLTVELILQSGSGDVVLQRA